MAQILAGRFDGPREEALTARLDELADDDFWAWFLSRTCKHRAQRKPSDAEEDIIERLYKMRPVRAFVTTTAPLPMGALDDKGPWNGRPARIIPAGTTLRIVLASRMGDFGLTDQLDADFGYQVRLTMEDAAMSNIRLEP